MCGLLLRSGSPQEHLFSDGNVHDCPVSLLLPRGTGVMLAENDFFYFILLTLWHSHSTGMQNESKSDLIATEYNNIVLYAMRHVVRGLKRSPTPEENNTHLGTTTFSPAVKERKRERERVCVL